MTVALMLYVAGLPLAALALDATDGLVGSPTPRAVRIVVVSIWPAIGVASLVAILVTAFRRQIATRRGRA